MDAIPKGFLKNVQRETKKKKFLESHPLEPLTVHRVSRTCVTRAIRPSICAMQNLITVG